MFAGKPDERVHINGWSGSNARQFTALHCCSSQEVFWKAFQIFDPACQANCGLFLCPILHSSMDFPLPVWAAHKPARFSRCKAAAVARRVWSQPVAQDRRQNRARMAKHTCGCVSWCAEQEGSCTAIVQPSHEACNRPPGPDNVNGLLIVCVSPQGLAIPSQQATEFEFRCRRGQDELQARSLGREQAAPCPVGTGS